VFDGLDHGIRVLFIAPADLLVWADRIRPHLAKMADGSGGRYETQDLFAEIASARMLLWVALEGADMRCVMLGQIMVYPQMRALRLTGLVGNNPHRWRGLLRFIEDQAKRQFNCTMMESVHQPRHGVLLRGYTTTHWLSEKAI
jgi:hypothetical protein